MLRATFGANSALVLLGIGCAARSGWPARVAGREWLAGSASRRARRLRFRAKLACWRPTHPLLFGLHATCGARHLKG